MNTHGYLREGAHPLLAVQGLRLTYPSGAAEILKGVSFSVRPGEMLALVGPNGSGKSTLLRCVSGIQPPTRGEVSLQGRDLAKLSPRLRARQLAWVSQSPGAAFAFTVREVVMMGRYAHQDWLGRESAADRSGVDEALDLVGLSAHAGRLVEELSGGEVQRVFLAQALVKKPGLLVLDEPTAHLDLQHQLAFLETLQELNRREGLTMLMSIHDLNLASAYCARILVLADGELLADGATAEVLTPGLLAQVFGVEAAVDPHPIGEWPRVTLLRRASTLGRGAPPSPQA